MASRELREQRRRVYQLKANLTAAKRAHAVLGLPADEKRRRRREVEKLDGLIMAAEHKLKQMERDEKRR